MVPDCAVVLAPLCFIYSCVSCVWNFRNRCIICHIDDLHASLQKGEDSWRFPVLEGDPVFCRKRSDETDHLSGSPVVLLPMKIPNVRLLPNRY